MGVQVEEGGRREPVHDVQVLLVDDDPDFAEMAGEFLEREREALRVTTETGAHDGLERLREGEIDAVVSDYDMPGMDGLEFLEAVREDAPNLPFILFTGKGSEGIARDAISAGVTDYLQKDTGTEQYALLGNRVLNAVEKYRAEREIHQTYRAIETAREGISVLDESGRFTYVNEAYADLYGYDPEALLGEHWEVLYHEEDVAEIREEVLPVVYEEGYWRGETRGVRRDGATIVEDHGLSVTDDGALVCAVRDITDRKGRERELERSRRRFEAILDSPDSLIGILEPDGTLLEVNETALGLVRAEPEDVDGTPFWETPWWSHSEELQERLQEWIERAATGEHVPFEACHRTPDGQEITVDGVIRPVTDEDGAVVSLIAEGRDVTERKERQRELEQYETATNAAGDMVYILDVDGRLQFVNDAAEELTGYDQGTLLDEHVSLFMEEKDLDTGRTLVRELLQREAIPPESESFEWTLHTADGDTTPCESHVTLLWEDGDVRGTVGVVRDITDRREHQRAVRSLHEATRELVDAPTSADIAEIATTTASTVLGLDVNGVFFYEEDAGALVPAAVTDAGRDVVGPLPTFEPGESLAWEVFRTGEAQIHRDVRRQPGAYNPDTPIRSEILLPLGDHGVFIVGSPAVDAFDETDVTLARVLAANVEAALDRAERERTLRAERDRFAALFEMIPEPVVHTDFKGEEAAIRNVNSAFEETFGVEGDAVAGAPLNDLIVPDDRMEEAETIDDRARSGETLTRNVRRLAADGLRDFLFRSAPIDEAGTEQFGIYVDITDQKEHERKLARQTERLEEFASVVSHDLRNPLSVAMGQLDLARETDDQEHIERARGALDRMNTLIEDLLTLARQGRIVEEPESVDVEAVVRPAWATVASNEGDAELRLAGGDLTVSADPERLRQVFENLFRNAIEHAGPAVAVEVGPLGDGEGIYVEDDGPGIPPDERDRVFDRGYSTGDEDAGFGLAIVERIVDAHDWTVEVTEGADGGARFEITGVRTTGA